MFFVLEVIWVTILNAKFRKKRFSGGVKSNRFNGKSIKIGQRIDETGFLSLF